MIRLNIQKLLIYISISIQKIHNIFIIIKVIDMIIVIILISLH